MNFIDFLRIFRALGKNRWIWLALDKFRPILVDLPIFREFGRGIRVGLGTGSVYGDWDRFCLLGILTIFDQVHRLFAVFSSSR